MDIIKRLRKNYPGACRCPKCTRSRNHECRCLVWRERRCSVVFSWGLFADHVFFGADRTPFAHEGRRCDFIFVGREHRCDDVWVFVGELKDGHPEGEEVTDQLSGGARIAETIIGDSEFQEFVPLLVHGRGSHKDVTEHFKNTPIRFHSDSRLVTFEEKRIEISEDRLDKLRAPKRSAHRGR